MKCGSSCSEWRNYITLETREEQSASCLDLAGSCEQLQPPMEFMLKAGLAVFLHCCGSKFWLMWLTKEQISGLCGVWGQGDAFAPGAGAAALWDPLSRGSVGQGGFSQHCCPPGKEQLPEELFPAWALVTYRASCVTCLSWRGDISRGVCCGRKQQGGYCVQWNLRQSNFALVLEWLFFPRFSLFSITQVT